jgi:glycine cleavage system H protein
MNVPSDLKYARTHEWARLEADGTVSVGITDHAQERLGDMVFIELPEVGAKLTAGTECAVVESVKAAADVYAPVSGEVVGVNAAVRDQPQSINEDAYAAWLYRLRPANPSDLGALLDAKAYSEQAASEE